MTPARTQLSKPAKGSLPSVIPCRRLPRDLELSVKSPYTDEQIDRFCAAVAGAVGRPGAFQDMIERIDALLAKASPSAR